MAFTTLTPHLTPGAEVSEENSTQRFSIPSGSSGEYRLAQLDDYSLLPRSRYPHYPQLKISLLARSSPAEIPGTWGFGVWNNPFGFKLGFGANQLLPALPNAAWFFGGSSENHLSFNDSLPGSGFLAATFRSPPIPAWVLSPAILTIPLLLLHPAARLIRKFASKLIQQDTVQLDIDPTSWHQYQLEWRNGSVDFVVDGTEVFSTLISPRGPLGLVIWIDNQFASWTADGHLKYGTLHTSSSWIEIKDLVIQPGEPE